MAKIETEKKFKEELTELINKHSLENKSNTPDYILAEYLINCLDTFNKATNARSKFYGITLKPKKTSRLLVIHQTDPSKNGV